MTIRAMQEARERDARRRFAEYGLCPRCQSLPGNPCRDPGWVTGTKVIIPNAHLNRPKRDEAVTS